MTSGPLARLPSVEAVKRAEPLAQARLQIPDSLLTETVRETLDELRTHLRTDLPDALPMAGGKVDPDWIARRAATRLAATLAPSLKPVINATGVVVHTNLGRAPLAADVLKRMAEVASGYSNLEYDLDAGQRGSRHQHLEALLRRLVGAQACMVVNNNAAAVLLALTALARGREVIVSRSELIEIGGAFRLPDIMAQGGAVLREVGTTNRTRIDDYARAIGPKTALLMKAHQSNFAISGFTAQVTRTQLADLAHAHGLPFLEDLGSGLLTDLSAAGLDQADSVTAAVKEGVDLVTFSGDKLFGGPQAGLIVGRKDLVDRLKRHPLTRALRTDKLTLAGLEATAVAYLSGRATSIPVIRMLLEPPETVKERASRLAGLLAALPGLHARVAPATARVGGGAHPDAAVPSFSVELTSSAMSETRIEEVLRKAPTPVIGRVEEGRVVLDFCTLADCELELVVAALRAAS
ncbi:MAG: L-seryl-tRNA(Sec) selenium transferase [Deltaproteobacteria bacterium]|nr:L-seryl-tRNA(Sec) selenium transferase [Deltaproteobacteria bacterium]